ELVEVLDHQQIGEVDRAGGHVDDDAAGRSGGIFDFLQHERLGWAKSFAEDGFHGHRRYCSTLQVACVSMLADEKILITGPAGQIAFPLSSYLARDNEVWGIARFGMEGSRERVESAGIRTAVCDLAACDFGGLPDDFTYVIHLAAFQGPGVDYDEAIRVNAEG